MISLLKSKSDFFNKRAIFISADKLSVFHWEREKVVGSFLFDTDEAGRDNFKRYLVETANTPIYILVDVVEEEFRQDSIPHVFGSDRLALIERKRARLFRDANYFYTQNQGREEDGRRDDRLLFMAITNQETVKPIVELLIEHKTPLKGIISYPLLLQSYIKTLSDISDDALFVTMQSISGLRQTFFKKKELQISRLSKLPRYGTESYVPRINSEVDKIQRYLNSLRLIPNDTQLDVYILADSKTLDELESEKSSMPMIRRHYLDINKLFESTSHYANQSLPFSDQLMLNHLFTSNTKNCYASAAEMRYSKMRNMRYSMNIASALLVIFSLIFGGLNFINGLTHKQESEASKSKSVFYQARYDIARERLPQTPVTSEQVKIAVEAAKTLNEYKATPYEMMGFLGKGLEQFPDIRLDELDWVFSLDPNKGIAASTIETNNNSPINTTNNDDEKEVKYYQISNLKAHIDPFEGNYRDAIAMVNKFAETLRSDELAYDVSIESFPLDISSTATLQGDADAVGKEALFTLRVVIGVSDGKG